MVKVFFGMLFSGLISFCIIPVIIRISKQKNLIAISQDRSSHEGNVPNLGGIAIFYAIGICTSIFASELLDAYKFLFASLIILLYVGIVDDIIEVNAYNKIIAQLVVAFLVVIGSEVRVLNLHGLFGWYELPYFLSVGLSIFLFIILTNSFNLIDGIDGLAGGFACISALFMVLVFLDSNDVYQPLIIFLLILISSLLAFLYYNLFSKKNKIFMGDTGSMIIGFLLVFLSINLANFPISPQNGDHSPSTMPIFAMSAMLLPIVDTISVVLARLYHKTSPMVADKRHIHHQLLALGFTHKQATSTILLYFAIMLLITYILKDLEINFLFALMLFLGFLGAYIPVFLKKKSKNKEV